MKDDATPDTSPPADDARFRCIREPVSALSPRAKALAAAQKKVAPPKAASRKPTTRRVALTFEEAVELALAIRNRVVELKARLAGASGPAVTRFDQSCLDIQQRLAAKLVRTYPAVGDLLADAGALAARKEGSHA